MLPKRNKLPIQKFSPKAKTLFRGDFLSIKGEKNELGFPRVGVVISKKVAKSAFLRNALRRLVFHLFADYFKKSAEADSLDLLVVLKKPIIKIDSNIKEGIENELREGLKNI